MNQEFKNNEFFQPNGTPPTNVYYQYNEYNQKPKSSINAYICLLVIAVIAIAAVYVYFNTRKSDEELIRDRIEEFVSSYNNGDFDAVVECLATKQRNQIKGQTKLLEGLGLGFGYGGFSLSGKIDYGSLFSMGVGNFDGDFMEIELQDLDIYDDNKANVYVTMTMLNKEEPAKFSMVKEKGDWYIADMEEDTSSSD